MTEGAPDPYEHLRDPAEHDNPVVRARLAVEAEVPLSRRGPGWDRHWRELEAYVEMRLDWSQPEQTPTE